MNNNTKAAFKRTAGKGHFVDRYDDNINCRATGTACSTANPEHKRKRYPHIPLSIDAVRIKCVHLYGSAWRNGFRDYLEARYANTKRALAATVAGAVREQLKLLLQRLHAELAAL